VGIRRAGTGRAGTGRAGAGRGGRPCNRKSVAKGISSSESSPGT